MAQSIDFNALKARTMGSSNDEEAVTVDTRGLISKVLSRYSGKWFVPFSDGYSCNILFLYR
jgi:hypothetical protein